MKANKTIKVLAVIVTLLVAVPAFAQKPDGDKFTTYLGKDAMGTDFEQLVNSYSFEKLNDTRYRSEKGIELIITERILTQIHLYNNDVYGQFPGELPRGLRFGMSPTQVKAIMGKPTVSYNTTGYLEFEKGEYVYACSFTNGVLAQVSVSLK